MDDNAGVGGDNVSEAAARSLLHDGYAVLRDQFPERLVEALIADADLCAFTPPHPRAGGAFAMAALDDEEGAPQLAAGWLTEAAHREGLDKFVPNEASYQRYDPGGNGIPPHRDQRYYAWCIAIVTLQGTATFAVHASDRNDDVVNEWTTRPREVILLRGWQPESSTDPRPYHRIDPPVEGPRLMFQLRHNLAASTPPSPFLAALTDTEMQQAAGLATTPPAAHLDKHSSR